MQGLRAVATEQLEEFESVEECSNELEKFMGYGDRLVFSKLDNRNNV